MTCRGCPFAGSWPTTFATCLTVGKSSLEWNRSRTPSARAKNASEELPNPSFRTFLANHPHAPGSSPRATFSTALPVPIQRLTIKPSACDRASNCGRSKDRSRVESEERRGNLAIKSGGPITVIGQQPVRLGQRPRSFDPRTITQKPITQEIPPQPRVSQVQTPGQSRT